MANIEVQGVHPEGTNEHLTSTPLDQLKQKMLNPVLDNIFNSAATPPTIFATNLLRQFAIPIPTPGLVLGIERSFAAQGDGRTLRVTVGGTTRLQFERGTNGGWTNVPVTRESVMPEGNGLGPLGAPVDRNPITPPLNEQNLTPPRNELPDQ